MSDVLSLTATDEESFDGFSSFESDAETSKSRTFIKKGTGKTKALVSKKGKAPLIASKLKVKSKVIKPTKKSSDVSRKTCHSSDRQVSDTVQANLPLRPIPQPSTSSGLVNNQSSDFDISKLSYQDIERLRTVLGVQPPTYDNDYEQEEALGRPLSEMPNIHVEFETADVSDTENIDPISRGNLNQGMAKNFDNVLLGDIEDGSGNMNDGDWELPRLKAPEKGPAIQESLAQLINLACSEQCDIEHVTSKYKVPSNCSKLSPPLINQEIWKVLDRASHAQDKSIVDIQNLVSVGMSPIIKLTEVLKDVLKSNPTARALVSDSLTVFGQVQYALSLRRRYNLKPQLKRKYQGLCSMSTPISDKLFGDDLSKEIKTCDSQINLGKDSFNSSMPYRQNTRSFRGRPSYRRPYQGQRYTPYPSRGNYNPSRGFRGIAKQSRRPGQMASATVPAPNGYAGPKGQN